MLVKGKPRTRGIPEATPEPVAQLAPAGTRASEAAGVGTEEAAAEMFKAKPGAAVRCPCAIKCTPCPANGMHSLCEEQQHAWWH